MIHAVYLFMGSPGRKKIGDIVLSVLPYMGTDDSGPDGRLGFGIIVPALPELNSFFAPSVSRHAIRTWRALKMLECVSEVHVGTLPGCWLATDSEYLTNLDVTSELASRLDIPQFERVRREIMTLLPTAEETERLVKALIDNLVEVSIREFADAMAGLVWGRAAVEALEGHGV